MSQAINQDEKHLQYCLSRLKQNRLLEYRGEFGAEITTFIPFVAWLKKEGYLQGCSIKTYHGMRPYYFFLEDQEYQETNELRSWLPIDQRYWPNNSTYHAIQGPYHFYPDFRSHYINRGPKFDKPVIFMQNKFNVEWGVGPINFMPLKGLKHFFESTLDRFTIVYSRPGSFVNEGYTKDHNTDLDYPDLDIINQYNHVIHLEKYCSIQAKDYNQTKLEILAKSHRYAAVQGGGAHLLACFSAGMILLLDRSEDLSLEGKEYPHAYQHGPYKYLSSPSPTLLVARTFRDFNEGLGILSKINLDEDSSLLSSSDMLLRERLQL